MSVARGTAVRCLFALALALGGGGLLRADDPPRLYLQNAMTTGITVRVFVPGNAKPTWEVAIPKGQIGVLEPHDGPARIEVIPDDQNSRYIFTTPNLKQTAIRAGDRDIKLRGSFGWVWQNGMRTLIRTHVHWDRLVGLNPNGQPVYQRTTVPRI